eukprot:4318662-Prorocentrum_lima.AAC.1
MTSSLVGSEMCIRDRHRGTLSNYRSRQGSPHAAQWNATCPPPPNAVQAVSYTHLTLPTICSV